MTAKPRNERKTENVVRDALAKQGYRDPQSDVQVEEQKSNIEAVKRLLKSASKTGGSASRRSSITRQRSGESSTRPTPSNRWTWVCARSRRTVGHSPATRRCSNCFIWRWTTLPRSGRCRCKTGSPCWTDLPSSLGKGCRRINAGSLYTKFGTPSRNSSKLIKPPSGSFFLPIW